MSIKVIGAAIALVALAVAVVAAAILFGATSVPWGATQAEHSARYYPADVKAFAWLTLNPSMGQREEMREIWERFNNMRAFLDWMDEFEDRLKDEIGFDTDDVMTWIGDELSTAIMDIDIDNEDVEIAATIAVRDRDAAADFLANWLDFLEDENATDFDRGSINGYDVWVDEDNSQALALTEDLMVFATTKDVLEEILDRVAGEESETLASNENFMEARAALNERRFASVYLDYRQLPDALGEALQLAGLDGDLTDFVSSMGGELEGKCKQALFGAPDWTMTSASRVDRGIVFDMVSPAMTSLWPAPSEVVNAADMLPEDSLGFLSLSFDPDLDNLRKALSQCTLAKLIPNWEEVFEEVNNAIPLFIVATTLLAGPSADDGPDLSDDSTLADALELGLWIVDRLMGINLEDDFLDYLGGDFIVAALDVDFEAAMASEPTESLVDGVFMLSYLPDGEEELMGTVDDIADKLQSLTDKAPERVDVGAENDAHVFVVDGELLQPGYVFHDGYLTIGTTTDSLEAIVASQKGEGSLLSASEEYQKTVTSLPKDRQFMAYVNLNSITSRLDADDLDIYDEYEILSEGFSAMAMSATSGDTYTRVTFVMSFFPEK